MKKKIQDKEIKEVIKQEEGYKLSKMENLKTRIQMAMNSLKKNNGLTMKIIAGAGLLTSTSTVLVACDFGNDDENDNNNNNNNNNNENNNGGTIKPGDNEGDKEPEPEPEPEPPVDPEEPENPDKPVDPTPGDKFEIPEKYNQKLSDWGKEEVGYLLEGFTELFGQKLFTEGRFEGVLYNKYNHTIVGMQLDEVNNAIRTLIKYDNNSEPDKSVNYAEKTITFNTNEIEVSEYVKEIAAKKESDIKYNTEFFEEIFVPPESGVIFNNSISYLGTIINRDIELDSSRMDDMAKVLTSMEKFGKINKVIYATNYKMNDVISGLGQDAIIWSSDALIVNDKGQLQLVHVGMNLKQDLPYNSADKILDFATWKEDGLVEGVDFKYTSTTITSDKTFGGDNAVLKIELYEKEKSLERE